MVFEIGIFVGGLLIGINLAHHFNRQKQPERLRWCGWCGAPKRGHYHASLQCPVSWTNNTIHFFKPLTVEEWMKREGVV
jgi:hypothetical protein